MLQIFLVWSKLMMYRAVSEGEADKLADTSFDSFRGGSHVRRRDLFARHTGMAEAGQQGALPPPRGT